MNDRTPLVFQLSLSLYSPFLGYHGYHVCVVHIVLLLPHARAPFSLCCSFRLASACKDSINCRDTAYFCIIVIHSMNRNTMHFREPNQYEFESIPGVLRGFAPNESRPLPLENWITSSLHTFTLEWTGPILGYGMILLQIITHHSHQRSRSVGDNNLDSSPEDPQLDKHMVQLLHRLRGYHFSEALTMHSHRRWNFTASSESETCWAVWFNGSSHINEAPYCNPDVGISLPGSSTTSAGLISSVRLGSPVIGQR